LLVGRSDLVVIQSGGGYSGYMTSAGITIVADGSASADERLSLSMTNDTSSGVLRYADAGYEDALDEARHKRFSRVELDAAADLEAT
jgi:urocanate hydratase